MQKDTGYRRRVKPRNRKRIANLLVFVVFAILSMTYHSATGSSRITLSLQEETLLIEIPQESFYKVTYDTIQSITLQDVPSYGVTVDGGTAGKCNYGIWKNEEWGNYICYALEDVHTCIVMETTEGIVTFNFESPDATKAFYEAFLKKLDLVNDR